MALKEVKIELTNYCDKDCIHCSSMASKEGTNELSLDTVKGLIDEAIELGATDFVLTGGEATKYLDLPFVIYYLKQKGIKNIKLYTMIAPSEKNLSFLKSLHDMGLSEIVYSLNLSLVNNKQNNDYETLPDYVKSVLPSNAVCFANVTPFLQEISAFMPVSIHYCLTTLTKKDLDKLDAVVSKLDKNNFHSLSFLRYVPHGRGDNTLTLSSTELRALKPSLIDFFNKYPNKVKFGSPFNILDITYNPCKAADSTIVIGSDGSVYPCDAMKYFDYLGSGGNIYEKSLKDIYESDYFNKVRKASAVMNEECQNCGNKYCRGGCLAQKMINTIERGQGTITSNWYQENALRTINDFGSIENLKFNAYTGVFGEAGEFFDYMKKYYTHNLEEEKKAEIKRLASKELGDIMWYLSTSMALYYSYTLDEVLTKILRKRSSKKNLSAQRHITNPNLIEEAALKKDPLCPHNEESYSVDIIEDYLDDYDESTDVYGILYNFKKTLNQLDYIDETNPEQTKEKAIEVVASIVIAIASIAHFLFNKNLSDLLVDNIEKLKNRYPQGFDDKVANARIEANKRYKEEEDMKVKSLSPSEYDNK